MSVPVLAAAPVLIDGTGARTLNASCSIVLPVTTTTSGCRGPRWPGDASPDPGGGAIRNVAADTGEVLSALDTEDTPDKVIYLPCGDRRARSALPVPRPTGPTPTS